MIFPARYRPLCCVVTSAHFICRVLRIGVRDLLKSFHNLITRLQFSVL